MRAMEATRQGWVANGERKPQSRCDYHHKCKTCGDLKSWERDAEGVVTLRYRRWNGASREPKSTGRWKLPSPR